MNFNYTLTKTCPDWSDNTIDKAIKALEMDINTAQRLLYVNEFYNTEKLDKWEKRVIFHFKSIYENPKPIVDHLQLKWEFKDLASVCMWKELWDHNLRKFDHMHEFITQVYNAMLWIKAKNDKSILTLLNNNWEFALWNMKALVPIATQAGKYILLLQTIGQPNVRQICEAVWAKPKWDDYDQWSRTVRNNLYQNYLWKQTNLSKPEFDKIFQSNKNFHWISHENVWSIISTN